MCMDHLIAPPIARYNSSHPPPSRTNAQYPIAEFNAECRTGAVLGLQKATRPPEDPASRFLTDINPRFCPSLPSVASPVRNGRRTLCGNMPLPPDSTPKIRRGDRGNKIKFLTRKKITTKSRIYKMNGSKFNYECTRGCSRVACLKSRFI